MSLEGERPARLCGAGAVRSTCQYESRRPPQAVLTKRVLEIAQTRLRYGYRRIRILTIIDAFNRLSPAIDVRQSCRGSDVVETLEQISRLQCKPRIIRVDNVTCPQEIGPFDDVHPAWLAAILAENPYCLRCHRA